MLSAIPPITRVILITNAVVFFVSMTVGVRFVAPLALWPIGPHFAVWQVLTYGFLHANLTHLFFNMFAVYMFGGQLERLWGGRRYALYYAVCLLSAAGAQLAVTAFTGGRYPAVGASGGVFGFLLAFALYFPRRTIVLLIPPIPMPAWLFVTLYGALELILGVTGTQASVAHFAHLGGMLGGYGLIRSWRARGPAVGIPSP